MLMPSISRYMTTKPVTVQRSAPLAEARRLMSDHGIRHLPVLDGRDLCGIVSDRDLRLLSNGPLDLDCDRVADAMTDRPFIVTSDAPLDEVVEIMGARKYGSVVVAGKDGVEGIFTAVDACMALIDVLRRAAA
ncbi:MAG TPA: CBS domain-containing protein [Kofleriaceae bacterium]